MLRRLSSPRRDGGDSLSLSFLDVLSCGLGSTIYLFMVFAILPRQGAVAGDSGGAVEVGSAVSRGRPVGANLALSELARRSDLHLAVRFESANPLALTEDSGSFGGLPASDLIKVDGPGVPNPGATAQVFEFVRMRAGGVDPARKLSFTLDGMDKLPGTTCIVSVSIGGFLVEKSTTQLGEIKKPLVVIDLQLEPEDWIHFPGDTR